MQEGGVLALTQLHLPDLSTFGIYPSTQGLCAQGAMLLAIFDLLIVRLAGRRAKRQLRERLEETSNSNQ